MCVIHLIHYLDCGHMIPDVQAMAHSRCDAVSAALIFYHDQLSWQPLAVPLPLPRTCQAVFPPARGAIDPYVLDEQVWWDEWMRWQFERNGFGPLRRWEMMVKALGPVRSSRSDTMPPYPENHLRQYHALFEYQGRRIKAPNVVFTKVSGACGRGITSACSATAGRCKAGDHTFGRRSDGRDL